MSMLVMPNRMLPRRLAHLLVLLALLWLAGCAGSGVVTPEGDALPAEPAMIERFEDGRVGFVIHEVSQLDGDLREAFAAGVTALEAQEYTEAVTLFEGVVDAKPLVSAPYIDLAIAYRHTDQKEKAQQMLQRALELVPGHPLASQEYGQLLRSQGNFEEAREVFTTSLEAFPEYFPLHKNLAILCDIYIGDLGCAYDNYVAYSTAQPDDEQVKIWLADLQSRLSQ